MRAYFTLLPLTLLTCAVWAQDPGMLAAQQAMQQTQLAAQAAQQASDQAMHDAQQANQAMQNAQQQATQTAWPCNWCAAAMPKFSMKPGNYSGPITVKIKDSTRGAVIYYTTDGWTPTAASTRYTGPIALDSTTTLQAIAISPYGVRSRVANAVYTLKGAAATPSMAETTAAVPNSAVPPSAQEKLLLARDTAVPLMFVSSVSSKTAEVGDKISLTLAEDLKAGNVVVVKKGAPLVASVIEVDRPGMAGAPGDIFFQVDSLRAGDTVVRLRGGAAKEGQDKVGRAIGLMIVPGVPAGLFVHGKEAEIKPGAVFTAFVDADVLLPPAN